MACFLINGNTSSSLLVSAKLLLIVLTIFFGFSSVTDGFGAHHYPNSVIVRNKLSPNTMLTYHCKSADDDLGERSLAFDVAWSWEFYVNFWDTTLFWCNFWWDDNGRPRQRGYQVFKAKRDMDRCGGTCEYDVRSDGLYGYNLAAETYLVYKWPWS
ncbi:hypothetical protein MKX03_028811 [Papaver bracteatum]|nr:hypothetical protein MKX03_028811 [Papaver bracteatum]